MLAVNPVPCVSITFIYCIRHEVVVHEGMTLGYSIYRTKKKLSSVTDRQETSLTEQPINQKNEETAHAL